MIDTFLSIIKIFIRSKFNLKLPETENNSCIVLGNGPSLKDSLLKHNTFFKLHELVCVNSFATTSEFSELKPQYYVILDDSFWKSDGEIVVETIEALRSKTNWNLNLFIPQIASRSDRYTNLCKQNSNIKLHYYNYTVFNGSETIANWFYKKNLAMPQSQNVLVASIFLSINLGFKEIYLVGADHSWHQNLHVDENNVVCVKDVHFFENEENVKYRPFKKGIHIDETFKMYEILTAWSKAFYGYIALNKYAAHQNCKIYNSSELSFIDAFERKKIN
ncbi:MAG: DUF115 domain-containing protein [Bacteroidetes bacterium]|nr:DUF115 domain-containing protein [Bacteroidota bacterium]